MSADIELSRRFGSKGSTRPFLPGNEAAAFLWRFHRRQNHSARTRTRVPTTEITHARTIRVRFDVVPDDGAFGDEPSSGGRVAVGIESVLVLSRSHVSMSPYTSCDASPPASMRLGWIAWTHGSAVTLGPSS